MNEETHVENKTAEQKNTTENTTTSAVNTSKAADEKTTNTPVTESKPEPTDHTLSDPANKATDVKPADPQPAEPETPVSTDQPKKLADVTETSLVWISGMVGDRQIDCAGPIELPFKITKPTWPYTPVEPNVAYTNQVFDYDSGAWVATDAKSQGQQLTGLAQRVQDLQKDSEGHDKSVDRVEKMSVQTTRMLTSLTQQMATLSSKLDTVLNTKEGDK